MDRQRLRAVREGGRDVRRLFPTGRRRRKKEEAPESGGGGGIGWQGLIEEAARLGIPEREFWLSTPRYFAARQKAWQEQYRLGWEQARFLAFFVIKTVDSKRRVKRFSDIAKFPWEKNTAVFAKQSREQLQKFSDEADEVLRLTQPEAYKAYMEAKKAAENGSAAT
jgi:hypothetical protein